jgi:hypothetical protein
MYQHLETTYIHADSSSNGLGGVLNENASYPQFFVTTPNVTNASLRRSSARCLTPPKLSFFTSMGATQRFSPQDNITVVASLIDLSSRSQAMMEEERCM